MNERVSWKERFFLWKKDIFQHQRKILLSIVLIIIALILNFISGSYVEKVGRATPPDLLLDFLPATDVSFIYVWLFLAVIIVFIMYPLICQSSKIHYMFGLLSLFMIIRSGFIVLTHLRMPLESVSLSSPAFYDFFSFSNALFFSAVAGLPFLGFLMHNDKKILRIFFLSSSIILSFSALLMHRHYSIDIFSAFFITYGIYKMGDYLFKK